jgi:hypothetical protein
VSSAIPETGFVVVDEGNAKGEMQNSGKGLLQEEHGKIKFLLEGIEIP